MLYDLTVVGAGLVGATTALALANQDIRVRLIDSQAPMVASDKPDLRVVALNNRSIEWLKQTNLWSSLDQSRIGQFSTLAIEDNGETLRFDAAKQGLPRLGIIAENNHIIATAQQACLNHPNIIACFSEEFVYDSQDKLIIAADGAHSSLRNTWNIPCFTHDYQQKAWVCYVRLEKPHNNEAWQHFLPNGPIAFLPMRDPHVASMVWTRPIDAAADITSEQIQEAANHHYGHVEIVSSVASFPLRMQLADQYYKNNVVFVGDAIHSIHPLAGQGVNLGFADAHALTTLLSQHDSQHFINEILLKRYQRERKSHNLLIGHSMSALNMLFCQDNLWIRSARKQGVSIIENLDPVKLWLMRL